jgi:hypothetical protein
MLMTDYQWVEVIVGIFLFIPLYYFYLKITNESVTINNIMMTSIFVGIILIGRYIGMNYMILTEPNKNI